jgi:hypothetical protein
MDVLNALEGMYLGIGQCFMDTEAGSFEESILKGLMATLRTSMRQNELCLQKARKEMWNIFEEVQGEDEGHGDRDENEGEDKGRELER